MASATTLTAWMEELALTLISPTGTTQNTRRRKESFVRRIKQHGYGRTNQFDVAERLNGLEEKLQVLSRDDVAEALYCRRLELKAYKQRWVPDALDFLLHLSDSPAKKSRIEDLDRIRAHAEAPLPLTWAEIGAEDPIDRKDLLWKIPDYSDFSSDEEETISSTAHTSPASTKPGLRESDRFKALEISERLNRTTLQPESSSRLRSAQFWNTSEHELCITELQAARQVLLMLNGQPTPVFQLGEHEKEGALKYRVGQLDTETTSSILKEASEMGRSLTRLRDWLKLSQSAPVMQLVQSDFNHCLGVFEVSLGEHEYDLIHQATNGEVVSLLRILDTIKEQTRPLHCIIELLRKLTCNDTTSCLNLLHEQLDVAYLCCDQVTLNTLVPIFSSAFRLFTRPYDHWLLTGNVEPSDTFAISETKNPGKRTTLWHDWFTVPPKDLALVPTFFRKFVEQIFVAGKARCFLRHLGLERFPIETMHPRLAECVQEAAELSVNPLLSFTATLDTTISARLTTYLSVYTSLLQTSLESACSISTILDAFDHLYLGKNGAILSRLDNRLFSQIDQCRETWNDRFLFLEALEEAYFDLECISTDSLAVHNSYTSSRTMESRRRSVKILSALSISYALPWPLANIIAPASMKVYQRIGLLLAQIRRAKFTLERRAYFCVSQIPLGDASDQKYAQALYSRLSICVNILYIHLTECTIGPLTGSMRQKMHGTVDEMIHVHLTYIRNLEQGCLLSARLSSLRDALIALLDLCIRFTDLVYSPLSVGKDTDSEVNSFISALSHRRRRRAGTTATQPVSSDDDDDDDGLGEGEGYSTFILDADTSLMDELHKTEASFDRHLSFLLPGVRGVARNVGEVGPMLELLADSLDGVYRVKRSGLEGL